MKLNLNETYLARKKAYFGHVSEEEWNDWKWQTAHRIRNAEELKKYVPLTKDEEDTIHRILGHLRMAITPYYLTLIDLKIQIVPLDNRLFLLVVN